MKKYVNNNGYTLVEALVSIMILSLVIGNLLVFSTVIIQNKETNFQMKQIIMFNSQLNKDLIEAKSKTTKNSTLIIDNYLDEKITYEIQGDDLVRKVDSKGYEIMMNNIKKFEFFSKNKIIKYRVIFNDDEQNEYIQSVGKVE